MNEGARQRGRRSFLKKVRPGFAEQEKGYYLCSPDFGKRVQNSIEVL